MSAKMYCCHQSLVDDLSTIAASFVVSPEHRIAHKTSVMHVSFVFVWTVLKRIIILR